MWLPCRGVWQPLCIRWKVMKQRIYQYILEHHMIDPGDCVCVACSGGADSICLLTVLHALRREGKLSCTLMACHLNHMLRGQESDKDEAFVRETCAKLGIPLIAVREDVARLAADEDLPYPAPARQETAAASCPAASCLPASCPTAAHPAGLEAAGRAARERLYETCIREHGAAKIALAHHMDDQAETVLFHMARGAALPGLSGIRPVHGFKIRPLLGVRRTEIENWLTRQGLSWRDDATNAEDNYARNRIRHHILPVLESEINAGAVRHIAEAAETIQLADQWIQKEMQDRIAEYLSEEDNTLQISRNLQKEPEFVQRAVIMHALTSLAGTHRDIGLQHVRQVEDLLTGASGRKQDLPHGISAAGGYHCLVLRKKKLNESARKTEEKAEQISLLNPEKEIRAELSGFRFKGKITEIIPLPIPEKTYTKWLNCDKIKGTIAIRTRRPGDYILLDAAGRRQSVKAWMINQKIPREQRNQIPLVVHGNPDVQQGAEVLWIVGGRISASAKVDSGTKCVLQLTAERIN